MSNCRSRNLVSAVLVTGLVAVCVSGCAIAQQRHTVKLAERDLIGISRATLLDCAGVPARIVETGDRETISYIADNPESDSPKRAATCVANFTLRRGYVEHLHYETLAGRMVLEREACEPIVDDCMEMN